MKRIRQSLSLVVALALALAAGTAVHAQKAQTFVIRDGQVWINDRLVPPGELPEAFPLEGIQLQYSLTADASLMLNLRGRTFKLEDAALHEVTNQPESDGTMFFFSNQDELFSGRAPTYAFTSVGNGNTVSLLTEHAQVLREHHDELDRLLSKEVAVQPQRVLLTRLRNQAAQAAAVAEELPRLEVRSYLTDMQQQDKELYNQLLREWQMEEEAQQLAWQIRGLQAGQEREQLKNSLRGKLDVMFEMKQENRRREIQQLELELQELRQRLQERENLRDRIIEQRLNELIGVRAAMPRR